jgi:PAS domain S-box-containing protein
MGADEMTADKLEENSRKEKRFAPLRPLLAVFRRWLTPRSADPAEEALTREEAELRATLYSIGDAVIATDVAGRVARMNPVAAQLTGWTEAEAAGKPLKDVFYIVNEETRHPVENPVTRVLREGTVVGLANHTLLIARDGREITITDAGAPILDARGNITGVVLVFRDQIEEHLTQRFIETRLSLIEYAASHTLEELLTRALDEVGTFVDSPIGFYHFVEPDQKTLSLQQWSTRTLKEFCQAEGKGRHYGIDQAGVWVDCVYEKRPVIHNDYAALPHKKGMPEGHAEVIRELVVPVIRNDKVVAILGVGNKPTEYTQKDVEIVSYLADVTWEIVRQKRAEQALRESEHKLRSIVEQSGDGIVLTDEQGSIFEWNRGQEQISGLERSEVLGKPLWDVQFQLAPEGLRTPDLHERLKASHREFRRTGQAPWLNQLVETVIQRPDGARRALQSSLFSIETDQGFMTGAISRDITERERAEEERERLLAQIQEQARQTQQIMDTVPEGMLLLSADGQVVLANPVGEKDLIALADAETGDTLTRLGDRPLAELLISPPKGLWHEVATDGRSFEVIARPIESSPEPESWVLVIRDVTQQREVERRVQQQERLAAVGQLAAGIAHDFNNIMAVITLYADMSLRTPGLPAQVYERLEMMDQQARRASELIQQVLDFSRHAVLERRPMDLLVFLEEQVRLLKRTLPESIKIDLVYGENQYTVNADPTRMQQAIVNLAVNARDAMPEGGELCIGLARIWVEDRKSAPLPEMEPGEWVRVTVADSGVGIPLDVLSHIFEPFFTTKAPGEGTGLGLAQVYGIVKQHDGHIDVATKVEEGTTFTLYLPALPVAHLGAPARSTEGLLQGQGETLLVVEDDATTRKALADSLRLLGYQVLEAANGREGLTAFERHADQIALVLSDAVMPEMGGQALFQSLRQRDPAVKVVLLTGHPLGRELEHLRGQGLIGWMPKPPRLERLAEVVAQALKENSSGV